MSHVDLWARIHGLYQRQAAALLFRRPFVIDTPRPVISFTFDDFPRSALLTGGRILNRFGVAATYYASLGLMGEEGPTGQLFTQPDLVRLLEEGHELGCHTFSHCHSWHTRSAAFERSIVDNRTALAHLIPGAEFKTLSYPISHPRPHTKARMSKHFSCCRGGGQTYNANTADLNHLSAFFLEKSRRDLRVVQRLIDRNREARGWLILATHDVADDPTPFGCTAAFFEEVVRYACESTACILPLSRALDALASRTVPE